MSNLAKRVHDIAFFIEQGGVVQTDDARFLISIARDLLHAFTTEPAVVFATQDPLTDTLSWSWTGGPTVHIAYELLDDLVVSRHSLVARPQPMSLFTLGPFLLLALHYDQERDSLLAIRVDAARTVESTQ